MYQTDLDVSTTLYNNPITVSFTNSLIKSPLDTFQRQDIPCKLQTPIHSSYKENKLNISGNTSQNQFCKVIICIIHDADEIKPDVVPVRITKYQIREKDKLLVYWRRESQSNLQLVKPEPRAVGQKNPGILFVLPTIIFPKIPGIVDDQIHKKLIVLD